MDKQMKNGDTIKCSLGTKTSLLQIPERRSFQVGDEKIGLISDNVGGWNIPSFCKCKRKEPNPTCTPTFTMKWSLGQDLFKVNGEKVLLNKSIIPCLYGGMVTFVD